MIQKLDKSVARHAKRRRGSLYVGVLATTSIVALVSLGGLSVAVINLRSSQRAANSSIAQELARSAVEEGVRQLTSNSSWRTSYTNGNEYPSNGLSLNGGTITWKFVDVDGSLSNNDADAVRVYGIGRINGAMYVESVELYPTGVPLTCLGASFQCNGNITTQGGCNLSTNQFVSSNGNINASAVPSSINGSAQAVGTVTGTVTLSKTGGLAARRMPSTTVFDYYLVNGTWIDFASIPVSSGTATIQKTLLAPTSNPFGSGNPEGIYVIDCMNQNLTVQNCRVWGTLVLINPGSSSRIGSSVNFAPVSPNFPALMVQGNINFNVLSASLSESSLTTNFNPPAAPYAGASNTNQTDKFPSQIKGLVYVSGQLTFALDLVSSNPFIGSVICTTCSPNWNATFTYAKTHADFPPPGFASGNPMVVMPGSWKHTALP